MFYSQLYICIYFKIIYLCGLFFSSYYTLILCCLIVVGATVRIAVSVAVAAVAVIRLRSPFHLLYQFPSNHIEIYVHNNKTLPQNTDRRR